MENEIQDKKGMKKTILVAFAILIGFFVISKILSSISSDPAQQSYEKHCASCHGVNGEGLKDLIPPLANADWLLENQDKFACIIKNGISGNLVVNGKTYNQAMDGKNLNDVQIYNIINYINQSWGNDIAVITTEDVQKQLLNCK
ncbi:MAG: c-type cytochrome [Chitinophagales bacterium]